MIPPFSLLPSIPRLASIRLVRVQSPCWSCGDVKTTKVAQVAVESVIGWSCSACDCGWREVGTVAA